MASLLAANAETRPTYSAETAKRSHAAVSERETQRLFRVGSEACRGVSERRRRDTAAHTKRSKLNLFRNLKSVFDLYAEVAHRALELGVPQKKLNGAKVSRLAIDLRGFRSP